MATHRDVKDLQSRIEEGRSAEAGDHVVHFVLNAAQQPSHAPEPAFVTAHSSAQGCTSGLHSKPPWMCAVACC